MWTESDGRAQKNPEIWVGRSKVGGGGGGGWKGGGREGEQAMRDPEAGRGKRKRLIEPGHGK